MSKPHELTADEISQLLPASELDAMAKELGLGQCYFEAAPGECDLCALPIGRLWVSISQTQDGEEADYYVCDACLPEKYRDTICQWSCYTPLMPCFVCGFSDPINEPNACELCGGIGEIMRSLRPKGQRLRAELRYLRAQSCAHYATGRRRKHWRRVMRKWHRIALRESRETGPRDTKSSLSRRSCKDCGKKYRAVWIGLRRGYCEQCGDCVAERLTAEMQALARSLQEASDATLFFSNQAERLKACLP